MTDSKSDIMPDDELEQKLRGAYDLMDPTPEQESRMLEAIMNAQQEQDENDSAHAPRGA